MLIGRGARALPARRKSCQHRALLRHSLKPRIRALTRRCPGERAPIVRRIALVEHRAEHRIGVGLRTIGAQAVRVVDPGVDDDPRRAAVAEGRSEALAVELGAEPMLAARPERSALAIFGARGVGRDRLKMGLTPSLDQPPWSS